MNSITLLQAQFSYASIEITALVYNVSIFKESEKRISRTGVPYFWMSGRDNRSDILIADLAIVISK
jgi:hypothetical protein